MWYHIPTKLGTVHPINLWFGKLVSNSCPNVESIAFICLFKAFFLSQNDTKDPKLDHLYPIRMTRP